LGIRANRCISGESRNHGWTLSQQISIDGESHRVSSSVPALMNVMSGSKAGAATIGEPHSGQNRRSTACPLSPVSWNVLILPLISAEDLGTATSTENAVPPYF
jgi:hypothetical protein